MLETNFSVSTAESIHPSKRDADTKQSPASRSAGFSWISTAPGLPSYPW